MTKTALLLIWLSSCANFSHAASQNLPPSQTQALWQLSPQLVEQGAAKRYEKKLEELRHGHLLDNSAVFLQRIENIFKRLQTHAVQLYPESAGWKWALHTSDEAEESSYCMAGGKLLISLPQAQRMNLNDAELAMLISHEMAHALLQHHFLEDQEVLRRFPVWLTRPFEEFELAVDEDELIINALAEVNKAQEYQADFAGLELASHAGFPTASLLRFYEKLRKHSAYPNFDSKSHPAPAHRLRKLKEWSSQKNLALN